MPETQLEELEDHQPLDAVDEDEDEKKEKPRQWLIDRCDGKERVMNPNSKPCCPIFYSPLLLKFFPDYMETNCVMEFLGKIGCISPTNTRARKIIMITATLGTIVGWAFLIFSDFAVSLNYYGMIDAAAFNTGSLSLSPCRAGVVDCDLEFDDTAFEADNARYSLGLRAIAITRYVFINDVRNKAQQVVEGFDSFCQDGDLGFAFVAPDQCSQCADASQAMVASILMSTVTYFFTFTTDVLRIWINYDVNCQKVFGGFFAILSAVMGLRTWFLFRNQCFSSFRKGWYCFDEQLNEIDCDATDDIFYGSAYFSWQAGPGLIALGVATFAKVFDLLCNIVIPTPAITRSRSEQWEYERLVTVDDTAHCSDNDNDIIFVEKGLQDCSASLETKDLEAGDSEVTAEIIVSSEQRVVATPQLTSSNDAKVRPSRSSSSKGQSDDKQEQFEKERRKLLEVIHGKRDRPVSVPTKYPETVLTNIVLGKGYFGVTYKGEDKEISQQFAIKAVDKKVFVSGNKDAVEKIKNDFKAEQRALLSSRHPNITMLYAYSLSASPRKGQYLLYELAEKGSLVHFWVNELGRERLSCFARRAQIALDAFIGLRFMHVGNKHVKPSLHRDIKSASIVLKRDMTAQMIDCGLDMFAQDPTSSTQMSTGVRGTRGYMCPKYCTGSISYDTACDIFSFGVVLCELWSGSLQNQCDSFGRTHNFFEEYIDEEDDGPHKMKDDLDKSLGFCQNKELPDYMNDFMDLALDCMARNPAKRPAGDEVMNRLGRIWQECEKDIDDEEGVHGYDKTIVDEGAFNASLQSVSKLHGDDESACRLCRTYAKEVGFDECPLCLALNLQRLRIAATVSSNPESKSTAPSSRETYALENGGFLQNIQQSQKDQSFLSSFDLRLNNQIPRLFIIVPSGLKDGWKPPHTWLRQRVATKYTLYFICGHTYQTMKPPIKFVASKVWMDKIALSLGLSLILLQLAASNGFDMNMQLVGSGSTALHVGPDELRELSTEVKHILDEGDNFDVLERIRSGSRLSDKDVHALNGETYELIVERAREKRGWRRVMVPVRKRGDANILWVCDAAAEDSRNDYEEVG